LKEEEAMANPGNTGHKGYKMSLVTSIEAQDGKVIVRLACGHNEVDDPYEGYTTEAWAQRLQGYCSDLPLSDILWT
jgi:hypothetical protein